MRATSLFFIVTVTLCAWGHGLDARAADETRKQDEQAIRAAAGAYIEALSGRDAKALAELWMPDGELVDEFGRATPARELIALETKGGPAANPGERPRVAVKESAIRFLTADVAIEDGRVEVAADPNQPAPPGGRFTAIWVKQAGRWRLASLREMRASGNAPEELAQLGWMVGEWTGRVGSASFDLATRWNHKHTFLERDLTVTHDGRIVLAGRQRIGIDPLDGKIKSWMHDDDGGHGEGIWSRHGDAWIVQAVGVTPEGKQTAATNVYRRDGNNKMIWKSTGALADGAAMPDFEVTLTRTAGGN